MKKYIFAGLTIEVTRRCNMACKHCLRGDAQNLTISKEIIDKIFTDTEDCFQLYIAGGEPLLELDLLKYLLDKASQNWNLLQVEITTNGSILDSSIVDSLESFCKKPLSSELVERGLTRKAALIISKDDFHVPYECQKAIDFYRPLFDDANRRLDGTGSRLILDTWSPINKDEVSSHDKLSNQTLIYAGRGKDLLKEAVNLGMNIRVPFVNNHRLKITDNVVHCRIAITAKGDVVVAAEDDSYDSYDKNAVGNILIKPMGDIINEHQNSCVISCNETNFINQHNHLNTIISCLSSGHAVNFVDASLIKNALIYEINTNILRLRQMLKATYPILPAQDLIVELPMVLNDENLNVLIVRIINNTYWQEKSKLAAEVDELETYYTNIYEKLNILENHNLNNAIKMCCEAIVYMKHNGLSLIMKLRKLEMQVLIDKAQTYVERRIEPTNDAIFACGESDIFSNEHDIGKEYSEDHTKADYYRSFIEAAKQ